VQACAHEPQLLTSLVVSLHAPLQSVDVGAVQPDTHAELWQTGVFPLHAMLHAPQWPTVLVRSTQDPLQLVKLALQLPTPHVPLLQAAVPLVTAGQTLPHRPQLLTSVLMSAQLPLHIAPHAPADVQHLVHPMLPHEPHDDVEHVVGASDDESGVVAIESLPPSSPPPSFPPSSALGPSSPLSFPASAPVCPVLPSSPLEASCPGYGVVVESWTEPSSWPVPGGGVVPPES
jgi:hypothetical protein